MSETAAPVQEMAGPVLDAINNLQASARPAHVIVNHLARKVFVMTKEALVDPCKSRVHSSVVTGSYTVEYKVDKSADAETVLG